VIIANTAIPSTVSKKIGESSHKEPFGWDGGLVVLTVSVRAGEPQVLLNPALLTSPLY